jgi:O-antigen/teichoic acid export membrane protein
VKSSVLGAASLVAAMLRHLASSAAGLLVIPLVSYGLGTDALAGWALLGTSAFVLGVADLGLSAAVQRASARRDEDLARELLGSALLLMAIVALPLAAACRAFVLDVEAGALSREALELAAWPTLAAGVVMAWGYPYRAWLLGRGELPVLARARVAAVALQVGATAAGLELAPSLVTVGVALLLSALLETGVNLHAARRRDPTLPGWPRPPGSWATVADALRNGSAALTIAVASLLALRLDVALVAHGGSALAVAGYAIAARAVDQSFTVAKQVSTALLPKLADARTRLRAIQTGTRVLGVSVAVGMAILCGPGRSLLSLWAGEAASAPGTLTALVLLALAATVAASHETIASALALGDGGGWAAATPLVIGYVVNVALSASLVGAWGAPAVALGTVVGNLVSSALLWSRALRSFGLAARAWARLMSPVGLAGLASVAVAVPLTGVARDMLTSCAASVLTLAAGTGAGLLGARRMG